MMLNGSEKCKGLWTREENGKKSAIDYAIIEKEDVEYCKSLTIDEEKIIAPFRLKKENGVVVTKYSDHNCMLLNMNLLLKEKEKYQMETRTIMTEENYKSFAHDLKTEKVSSIWNQSISFQDKYNQWSRKVIEVRNKNATIKKPKRKQRSKALRELLQKKKQLKKDWKNEENEDEASIIYNEIQKLKEMIVQEEQEHNYRRMLKTIETITKDGRFDSGGFWEFQKKMRRKKCDTAHAVVNLKGEKVSETEKILEAYEEYFKDLLTHTNNEVKNCNSESVNDVELRFQQIMDRGKSQECKKIKMNDIATACRRLKKRKAGDTENWKNELILNGGEEMNTSLLKMANEILQTEETPAEWEKMKIKAVHKSGPMELLTKKRGLFLTSIVSKLFEKLLEDQMGPVKFDDFQFGGTKGMGTVDNWFIFSAVIDEARRLKKNVYFLFGDLVKCFDRLWLKDCLVDLHEAGVREKEIRMLYQLNRSAVIKIATPVGDTKEIRVDEIAKQGTVFGTKLCCASTGKINNEETRSTVIYPNVSVKSLTFVDDIMSAGSHESVPSAGERCGKLEREKFWEFSIDKSKWMCIQFNKKEDVKQLNIVVKQGKVQETDSYKMLGNWANNKANIDTHLEHLKKKSNGVIHHIRTICCQAKVGKEEFSAKRHVYFTLATKSIFHNLEAWTNLRQADKEQLECIQGKMLKGIFGLPKTTPYWGILHEFDIPPVHLLLTYMKLMLYHNLINSKEERMSRKIVETQEKLGHTKCWYGEVTKEAAEIGITLGKNNVQNLPKSKWKKHVKEKVRVAFELEFKCKQTEMKKLRFLQSKGMDTYMKYTFNDDARFAMMIRLNVLDIIPGNFGRRLDCELCGNADNSTEHVFLCSNLRHHDLDTNNLCQGDRMREIVELFGEMESKKREALLDSIILNSNILSNDVGQNSLW